MIRDTGQYAAFTAFIEPGDEVIIFEPFFDQYLPSIAFHGGKCVYVPLHPSSEPAQNVKIGKQSWTNDFDELRYVAANPARPTRREDSRFRQTRGHLEDEDDRGEHAAQPRREGVHARGT